MKTITLILAVFIIIPVYGQRAKKKDDGTEVIVYDEGIVYSLPRVGVKVDVKATEIFYTPGPYAQYADELLGIKNVKTQVGSNWSIDEISIDVFSEPDPDAVYKTNGKVASLINLTANGCISGINTGSIESLNPSVTTNRVSYQSNDIEAQFRNLSDSPFFVPGDSTNRFKTIRLSVEQKAAQAAARILECRKMRYETAVGYLDELPPDGKAYQESLNELSKIENEFIELFIGKEIKNNYSYSFNYIPSSKTVKGEVLFRFSDQRGVLEKSDLSGKPVILEIEKDEELSNKLKSKINSENPFAGESGIYYRMPGMAEIKIIYELKTIVTARTSIAQFGSVAPVPEDLLDGNYRLVFSPVTGSIKNISQK